jgi:hypothetical protein
LNLTTISFKLIGKVPESVTWASLSQAQGFESQQLVPSSYMCVEIENIFCGVHVVPNFVENDHFFVNMFKF